MARALEAVWWGPLRPVAEPLFRRALAHHSTVFAGRLAGARFEGGLAHKLGIYEPELQRLLARLIKPGFCVLDVGGHLGFTALLASRLAGPVGTVVVFEPDPENRQQLEANVSANPWARVEVAPLAVSDRSGPVQFDSLSGPQSRLGPASDGPKVQATSLDDWLSGRPDLVPSLVKVDVEGAELQVLEGARQLLQLTRPQVVIEVHDADKEEATRVLLQAHGYAMSLLPQRSRRPPFPRHLHADPVGRS